MKTLHVRIARVVVDGGAADVRALTADALQRAIAGRLGAPAEITAAANAAPVTLAESVAGAIGDRLATTALRGAVDRG